MSIRLLTVASVLTATVFLPRLGAQAPEPLPSFEVASIKQNKSGEASNFIRRQPGGRFNAQNMTARTLITFAYQLQGFQLEGGPGWLTSDRWDIVAKAEGDPPPVPPGGPPDPLMLMLRSLLAERFKLVMHGETKEMPIYSLVLAREDGRLGSQLQKSSLDCAAQAAARARGGGPPPAPPAPGERMPCSFRIGFGQMMMSGFPVSEIARSLSGMVQRVVLDRTGLTGPYEMDLKYTPEQSQLPGGPPPPGVEVPAIDPNGPSLFTALQEQLGLKLEPQRGPVDVTVIDSIERPVED
jgi:uncharacterized protein (TIGR03435 family)